MAEFRILSLDGGGPWALIQVKALIELYSPNRTGADITGRQVLKKFDMAVANSGGTITLAGLIKDLTLADILQYFMDEAKRKLVFVRASLFQNFFSHITGLVGIGPRYDTKAKLAGLKTLAGPIGETLVTDLPGVVGNNYNNKPLQFLFCAFDYDMKRASFFRSDAASLAGSGSSHPEITLVQAIHASSNAPVNYFDAPADGPKGRRYWDGAVGGYNNPIVAGLMEVLANGARYGTDRSSIKVLSIGTGNTFLPLADPARHDSPDLVIRQESWTVIRDLKKMATSILEDPPDAATFHGHVILGGPMPARGVPPVNGRLVRMNPLVQPVRPDDQHPWEVPAALTPAEFVGLRDMPLDAIEPGQIALIEKFCRLWIEGRLTNQAIRAGGPTFAPEIGFGTYAGARAAWSALCGGVVGPVPR